MLSIIIIMYLLIICILLTTGNNMFSRERYIVNDCNSIYYEPNKWHKKNVQQYNNCYSYAINKIDPSLKQKPYPGYFSGNDRKYQKTWGCDILNDMMKKDIPEIHEIQGDQKCPCGFHKIMLFVDDHGSKKDFHYYRQDFPDSWSHKPGSNKVTKYDRNGNLIYDPIMANRDYRINNKESSGFNYNKFCGQFCVKNSN